MKLCGISLGSVEDSLTKSSNGIDGVVGIDGVDGVDDPKGPDTVEAVDQDMVADEWNICIGLLRCCWCLMFGA